MREGEREEMEGARREGGREGKGGIEMEGAEEKGRKG